jgi:tetratricopeptide (TPR) repeat protein
MRRWKESLKVYEKVQEADPDDRFARKEIYRLWGMDRPDDALIHELKTVIQLSPDKDDPQIVGLLAQKLKEAGKLKEAADEFHKAWRLDPRNLFFLRQEGFCHYNLGEYPAAIEALAKVFQ